MAVVFILGVGVTLSEPAIGALRTIGALLKPSDAPYLFLLLNDYSLTLQLSVGFGVGLAAMVGIMRQVKHWDLKPIILLSVIPTLLATTILVSLVPELEEVVGLAWDCGAVTTGPVTVPVILALGIGVSSNKDSEAPSLGLWCSQAFNNFSSLWRDDVPQEPPSTPVGNTRDRSASGRMMVTLEDGDGTEAASDELDCFGVVTLASLFPVLAVEAAALVMYTRYSRDDIMALPSAIHANVTTHADGDVQYEWYQASPIKETVDALRACLPLLTFLALVLRVLCSEPYPYAYVEDNDLDENTGNKKHYPLRVEIGLGVTVIGLIIFNLGLTYGLIQLGRECGGSVAPLAVASPFGMLVTCIFAFFLGLGATLAEPALSALGSSVERLSGGRFKAWVLILAVGLGVASGVLIGVLRILYQWRLLYLLITAYTLAIALTLFSSKEYVAIAWDSAGVTTGPVTVPLVLALGLGVSNASGSHDGFGILTCASFCPIISVLICGLLLDRQKALGESVSEILEQGYGITFHTSDVDPMTPQSSDLKFGHDNAGGSIRATMPSPSVALPTTPTLFPGLPVPQNNGDVDMMMGVGDLEL